MRYDRYRLPGVVTLARSLLLGACLTSLGCAPFEAEDPSNLTFEFDVSVTSDPGQTIAGASLSRQSQPLASTDAHGFARVVLHGREGDRAEILVTCPPGFQSPPDPIVMSLRGLASGSRAPSFAARCAPLTRTVVVGIRTENGTHLPVIYLGKEVGRTDAWGAAHFLLTVKAGEAVTLTVDTKSGAEKAPKLRPESPTLTFVAKDKDELITLEQKFEIDKTVVKGARASGVRAGPTRI